MKRTYTISIFVTISRFKYFENFHKNVKNVIFDLKLVISSRF